MAGESGGSWKFGLKTRCGGVALSSCVAVAGKERRYWGASQRVGGLGCRSKELKSLNYENASLAQLVRHRV